MTDNDKKMRRAQPADMIVGADLFGYSGTKLRVVSQDADGEDYFRLQIDLLTLVDRHLLKADDTGKRALRASALRSVKFYVRKEK